MLTLFHVDLHNLDISCHKSQDIYQVVKLTVFNLQNIGDEPGKVNLFSLVIDVNQLCVSEG